MRGSWLCLVRENVNQTWMWLVGSIHNRFAASGSLTRALNLNRSRHHSWTSGWLYVCPAFSSDYVTWLSVSCVGGRAYLKLTADCHMAWRSRWLTKVGADWCLYWCSELTREERGGGRSIGWENERSIWSGWNNKTHWGIAFYGGQMMEHNFLKALFPCLWLLLTIFCNKPQLHHWLPKYKSLLVMGNSSESCGGGAMEMVEILPRTWTRQEGGSSLCGGKGEKRERKTVHSVLVVIYLLGRTCVGASGDREQHLSLLTRSKVKQWLTLRWKTNQILILHPRPLCVLPAGWLPSRVRG